MKSRFSRRKFLGGAGVAIGLPYLESLDPRAEAATACDTRQRFVAGFLPCGIHMPDFTPTTAGIGWTPPYILEPLKPLQDKKKIAIITGIDYQDTAEPSDPPGGHGSGTGAFLTLRPVHNNTNDPMRTSIDQKIAQKITAQCSTLPIPSLPLGVKTLGDGCDGCPCSFLESISWLNGSAIPNITDPAAAFKRIFTGFTPPPAAGATPPAVDPNVALSKVIRTSILDQVLSEATSLGKVLGKNDKMKVDQYMTAIRGVETRIANLGQTGGGGGGMCKVPAQPTVATTAPYKDYLAVMLDLTVLALQCDITRVITFMFARGSSMVDWAFLPSIGTTTLHHLTSHMTGQAAAQQKLREIGRWEMEQWAGFLTKLDAISDGNGKTLLDNSLCYLNSEISDGNAHRKFDLPVVLAGTAGGKLKVDGTHHNYYSRMTFPRPLVGGRTAAEQKGLPLGQSSPLTKPTGGAAPTGIHGIKLFVSFLNAFGVMDQTFGDGSATGPIPELMVT
ncbi:MAG: DUF1552 domain-containing protein [Myxococcales bacterium]